MSSKRRLSTIDIQFREKYDPQQMRTMQQHINDLTRLNQKLLQMLEGGTDGQVLTKVEHDDLIATWGAGGGDSGPTLRTGHGLPDESVGDPGDLYIDLDTSNIYELEA